MRFRTLVLIMLCLVVCTSLLLGVAGAQGDQALHLQPPPSRGVTEPHDLVAQAAPETLRKIDPLLIEQFVKASPTIDGATDDKGVNSAIDPSGLSSPQRTDSVATFLVFLREDALARPGVRAEIAAIERRADPASARELRTTYIVEQLRRTAEKSQAPLRTLLQAQMQQGRVQAYRSYWVFNGFAVDGDLSAVLELAAHPAVEEIRRNRIHQLPTPQITDPSELAPGMLAQIESDVDWHLSQIGADRVWQDFGITGRGVVVANMDSGVDWTHPALEGSYRGTQSGSHDHNWFDPTGTYPLAPGPNRPRISGLSDHGTHTMGILMSVAPGAQWIALKLFDDRGNATDEWLHAGFQWVLAPTKLDGSDPDPARAPHIVSNSWGDDNPLDQSFRQGLDAWREAGIYSTWAAGNSSGEGTINSPAAFPEAMGVGASTVDLQVASFSSLGPSPWGSMIKPDVVAPGVSVRSTIAGGGFEHWNGTSMATPHVAGLAALLWETTGTPLPIDETTLVITSTATDIGVPGPDYASGYGIINAYQAVSSVYQSGSLVGSITDRETGQGIGDAVVRMRNRATGAEMQTVSDYQGHYQMTAIVGRYDVTVSAFGYGAISPPSSAEDIEIIADTLTQLDLALDLLPRGTIQGQVRVADGSPPPSVTVSLLNTPLETRTDAEGRYRIDAPVGSYALRGVARYPGYRGQLIEEVAITVGATQDVDLQLLRIPRLLLVDADAWLAGGSETRAPRTLSMTYYVNALDALLYSYDQHWILRPPDDVPHRSRLAQYDVVIWAQPVHSPGHIAAWSELGAYLDGGGHLLISGQDIGYWDVDVGHGRSEYETYLGAHYLRRDSALTPLHGLIDSTFAGLTLLHNTPDSAENQQQPDAIAPIDEETSAILANEDGTVVGLATPGHGHRGGVVYLSFGLEGVGPLDARAALIERAVAFLAENSVPQQYHLYVPLYFWAKTINPS